jgi:7-carboxy-7-deazaguanine synthase
MTISLPNTQSVSLPNKNPTIEIHHAFPTIQEGGPLTGTPAVLLNLYGCNLQCRLCTSDYTSKKETLTIGEILNLVKSFREKGLVVITGGEPFRQQMGPLTVLLLNNQYQVQFETNGTYYQDDLPYGRKELVIVCSPKTPKINERLERYIDAYKFILQAGHVDPQDGLPLTTLGGSGEVARPSEDWLNRRGLSCIYVQPLDEQDEAKNKANTQAAIETCMKYGYRLCLQVHKQIGLE